MTVAKRLSVAIVLAGCVLAPSAARASDADALFKEGRSLLDAKDYDAACPKLAESQKLDPGAGTLLALALCHEGQGKVATAHDELVDAAMLGRKVGRTALAAAAEKRAAALKKSVPKVFVRMPKGEGARYEVRLDGDRLDSDRLAAPIAVDPGEHRFEVSAKNKVARSYVVRLAAAGRAEVVVEELDDAPVAAVPPAPVPAPSSHAVVLTTTEPPAEADARRGGGQRALGVISIVAGAGAIVAGGVFLGKGMHDRAVAQRVCETSSPCNEEAQHDNNERAKESMNIGVISAAAGTGALALGAILLFTAPKGGSRSADAARPNKATARLAPDVSPTRVGVGLSGTF